MVLIFGVMGVLGIGAIALLLLLGPWSTGRDAVAGGDFGGNAAEGDVPEAVTLGMLPGVKDPFLDALGDPRHKGLTDSEWERFLNEVVGPAQATDDEFEIYLNGHRDAPEPDDG